MSSLLTVVITVYNEEKYIADCVESVISQSYDNLEIIIVDDGSTDNSLNICNKLLNEHPRIKVISKDNGGPMSARKAGMRAASGAYITYIDGDDYIDKDLYLNVMNDIDDADIYCYGLTCIYDNNRTDIMKNSYESGTYTGDKLQELKEHALYNGAPGQFGILPSMCSKVFRKALIEQNLYRVDDDVRMGDDGCCTFPSVCDAGKIIINNDITGYMYRKTDSESITSSYNYVEFSRIERVYETLYTAFTDRHADYMLNQLTYYLAFMYRNEMVYELANLTVKSIPVKLKHLKEISTLKWVRYIIDNADADMIDRDTKLFVQNTDNCTMLMVRWYSRRLLNHR